MIWVVDNGLSFASEQITWFADSLLKKIIFTVLAIFISAWSLRESLARKYRAFAVEIRMPEVTRVDVHSV